MKSASAVLAAVKSGPNGLTNAEARARLEKWGRNELVEAKKIGRMAVLLRQLKSPLIWILIIAGIISAALELLEDAIVITFTVCLSIGLGFAQEWKAEKAMAALKGMLAPKAKVIRDGKEIEIAAIELVPGDIILLEEGDNIPADARLIEVA
ncbi:MAG: cation-transporting P-type ATPase, partial [Candidatus Aenigmatarchaeota archaeon]